MLHDVNSWVARGYRSIVFWHVLRFYGFGLDTGIPVDAEGKRTAELTLNLLAGQNLLFDFEMRFVLRFTWIMCFVPISTMQELPLGAPEIT